MDKFFLTNYSSSEMSEFIRTCIREELQNQPPQTPPQEDDALLTVKEACTFLKTTPPTLRARVREGVVKEERFGFRPRYSKSELIKSIQNIKKFGREKI